MSPRRAFAVPALLILPWLAGCGELCPPVNLGMIGGRVISDQATRSSERTATHISMYSLPPNSRSIGLLGERIGGIEDDGYEYVVRAIEGIDPIVAFALATYIPNARVSEAEQVAQCGRWELTVREFVVGGQLEELERRVASP